MESYVNSSIRESVRDYFLESVEKQLDFFEKLPLFLYLKKVDLWLFFTRNRTTSETILSHNIEHEFFLYIV